MGLLLLFVFISKGFWNKLERMLQTNKNPDGIIWEQNGDESDLQQPLSLIIRWFDYISILNDIASSGQDWTLEAKNNEKGVAPYSLNKNPATSLVD